jgi:hypothetical protein
LDEDRVRARERLGHDMQALYHLPPEKFGHLSAAGTPEDVAEFLAPFVEGGATTVSIIPVAGDAREGVAMAGRVRDLLCTP